MPAKYRLSGSEHSLRELGVRLLGVEAGWPARFSERANGECSLTWHGTGTGCTLWLGARHGQAVRAPEWTERDKLGRRQARCEAVPVSVETLLGLGMLEEVKRKPSPHVK